LPHIVGLIAPGSRVEALLVRDGDEQSVTVEVGALASDQVARVDAGVSVDGSLQLLGMRVAEAEADTLADLGLSGGVVIEAVEADSPAAEAGVRDGDILTRLGSRPISRVSDVTAAADDLAPGSSVPARLIRGRSPLFIGIRIPDGD
jgi:serine protease Do